MNSIGMELTENEFMMEIYSSIYKCIHVLQLDKVFNKMKSFILED